MEKLKVKIEGKNLDFIQNILNSTLDNLVEICSGDCNLLITDTIPDSADNLFIVVWDKHDVTKIEEKIISFRNYNHKYLRGFFLKDEVRKNSETFIKTIKEVKEEVFFKKDIHKKAGDIKNQKQYIEIGSLVESGTQGSFEDIYGEPRFTTLFIDKPMLNLMSKLSRILEEIKPAIENMANHYKDVIGRVKETGGIDKTSKEFDMRLIEELNKLKKIAPVELPSLLLTGETGAGKTLIARWIYGKIRQFYGNDKYSGDIQEVNSSGLSANLLESDLFGHVKGAFTDAKTTKPGKALLAIGGVLFLDEIGDMNLEVQPKVMKFIEEKTFTPEGWPYPTKFYTPLLVIAATNKNLEEEVRKGTFRKDLYSRFKHRVYVPSIEERKGSLHVLIDLILQNYGMKEKGIKFISIDALEEFKKIQYEENWRELERTVRDTAYRSLELGLDMILPDIIKEVISTKI